MFKKVEDITVSNREETLGLKFRVYQSWSCFHDMTVFMPQEYCPRFFGLWYAWVNMDNNPYGYMDSAINSIHKEIENRKADIALKPVPKVVAEFDENGLEII